MISYQKLDVIGKYNFAKNQIHGIFFNARVIIPSPTNKRKGKSMEKKFSFSDQPKRVKVIYCVAIAILCITAIVIGIVGAASANEELPPTSNNSTPPSSDNGTTEEPEVTKPEEKPTVYLAPAVGTVTNTHSTDTPVFSPTLGEWRVHTGIDIAADEGSEVRSIADGKVTKVFNHPMHGKTVEITHKGDIVSIYSNLSDKGITVKEGDNVTAGAKIGVVGDTTVKELADEPHLHFELRFKGNSVNPLSYISEESKKASFGIE